MSAKDKGETDGAAESESHSAPHFTFDVGAQGKVWDQLQRAQTFGVCKARLDGDGGRWDSDRMTQAAKKLIEEFDALQDLDRAEVLAELLRRVSMAPHDLPDPADLTAAADRLFVELERREQPR